MVAAVSGAASTADPQNPKSATARAPLLPSEKDNKNGVSSYPKRPKSKIVSSRYMSPSTSNPSSVSSSPSSSRRFPSPSVSRISSNVPPSLNSKRSVSVDRRRPSVDRPLTPDLDSRNGSAANVSAASKLLITSTRSLSVSFQGGSFSLPVSKTKVTPSSPNLSSARKGTPERRRTVTPERRRTVTPERRRTVTPERRRTVTPSRSKAEGIVDQPENPKLPDQHRWPARNRMVVNPLSRSLDCGGTTLGEKSKLIGSVNGIQRILHPMIDERRASIDSRPKILKTVNRGTDGNSVNNDITTSDSDSVSSGSTSGVPGSLGGGIHGPSRGMAISARFWQETNSRLRRLQDPGSPLSTSPGSKILIVPPKSKRFTGNGLLSSPRMISSPIRGGIVRPGSPSKVMTPPARGNSPSRVRSAVSTISNSFSDTPSVLSFAVDVRRGKVGENRIVDAHFLRLLHNRQLQWRFVNARSDGVLQVQQRSVKKHLWNAWITISDLRDTVTKKRHRLQLLRQKLKLATILKQQMTFLGDWASLDKDHSVSLLGAIEALTASTLRLPIVGAIGDVQSMQEAIGSAFDIMQSMTFSIHLLLPLVEKVNSLVSELAKVTSKEEAMLEQCSQVISAVAAMQVKDSSLRTHIIQHNRL